MSYNPFVEIFRRLTALEKALRSLITIGTVSETNYNKGTVRIDDGNGQETAMIPWAGHKTKGVNTHDAPEEGQKMIAINNGQHAFAMYGGYSEEGQKNGNDPKIKKIDFADGAFFEHNQHTGQSLINAPNGITLTVGSTTVDIKSGKVEITGADLILPQNDVVAKEHSLDNHKHPNVMSGPATTGPAIP